MKAIQGPQAIGIRLGFFKFAFFASFGVLVPFLPKWLASEGLSPESVGYILTGWIWLRGLSSPFFGAVADRLDSRRNTIITLAFLSLIPALMFTAAPTSTLPLVLLTLAVFYPPLIPLSDELITRTYGKRGDNYGRVRVWGSVAFLFSAILVGYFIAVLGTEIFPFLFLGLCLTVALSSILLPKRSSYLTPSSREKTVNKASAAAIYRLFQPTYSRYWIAIFCSSAVQASHASYYAYSTIYWTSHGIGADVVGGLWAEGIVVEIGVFWFGKNLLHNRSRGRLLLIAGLAAIIRWVVIGSFPTAAAAASVQWLHGLTFGLAHLAIVVLIREEVADPSLRATAYGIQMALTASLAMGCSTLLAAEAYSNSPAVAFYLMSVFGGIGVAAAIFLIMKEKPKESADE